jgi:hypothetical protein
MDGWIYRCMDGWMDGWEVATYYGVSPADLGKTSSGHPKKKRVSKEEEEGKAVARTNSAT